MKKTTHILLIIAGLILLFVCIRFVQVVTKQDVEYIEMGKDELGGHNHIVDTVVVAERTKSDPSYPGVIVKSRYDANGGTGVDVSIYISDEPPHDIWIEGVQDVMYGDHECIWASFQNDTFIIYRINDTITVTRNDHWYYLKEGWFYENEIKGKQFNFHLTK